MCAIAFVLVLPGYVVMSFGVLVFEDSDRYVEAAAVTVVVVLGSVSVRSSRPSDGSGLRRSGQPDTRSIERQHSRTHMRTARAAVARGVVGGASSIALLMVVVGVLAGASGSRLVQYGILGAALGTGIC